MTDHNLDLPPDTDARLDRLLAEWVEHRGLSRARTEQLRQAVLAMHELDAATPALAAGLWIREQNGRVACSRPFSPRSPRRQLPGT